MITQYLTQKLLSSKGQLALRLVTTIIIIGLLGVPIHTVLADPGEQGTWG